MTTEQVQADLKGYELMMIINSEIGEDGIKARITKMRDYITSNGGEIFHEETWGLRDLAYRIRKQDRGFYSLFNFHFDTQKLKEMDRMLRLEPEVLRHLVTVLPPGYKPQDYVALAAKAAEEAAAEKELTPGEMRKPAAAAKPAPAHIAAKSEAPAPAPTTHAVHTSTASGASSAKKEESAPAKEEAPKPKKKEQSLEEVDAKLKSIIENPDLNF